ncbi:hypothetical protein [Streptomyces sp. NPDC058157]
MLTWDLRARKPLITLPAQGAGMYALADLTASERTAYLPGHPAGAVCP